MSQPRNKLIAEIFKASGLIEKYGSGIKRVLNAFKDYGLKQPEFRMMESGFRVKIFAINHSGLNENVTEKRQKRILQLIKKTIKFRQQKLQN